MSAGKLASVEVPATAKTVVYTTGDCIYADLNLNLVNTSTSNITTKVYITTSATAAVVDTVAHNQVIPANGGAFILDFITSPGEKIVVEPTAAGLVARVAGLLVSKPV